MEGDESFLKSIASFPDDHFFTLGAAGVQIRGGSRVESKRKNRSSTGGGKDKDKDKDKDKNGDKNNNNSNYQNANFNLDSTANTLVGASDEKIQNEERRERNEFSDKNKNSSNWAESPIEKRGKRE